VSIAIRIDEVTRVLLADGWHEVKDNSFKMDYYDYVTAPAEYKEWKGQDTVFSFIEGNGDALFGPVTSILAVSRPTPKKT
jgi:hypothetical protein